MQVELGLLKVAWTLADVLLKSFKTIYATKWDDINVDDLIDRAKNLSKDVKRLPKAIKAMEIYR